MALLSIIHPLIYYWTALQAYEGSTYIFYLKAFKTSISGDISTWVEGKTDGQFKKTDLKMVGFLNLAHTIIITAETQSSSPISIIE